MVLRSMKLLSLAVPGTDQMAKRRRARKGIVESLHHTHHMRDLPDGQHQLNPQDEFIGWVSTLS